MEFSFKTDSETQTRQVGQALSRVVERGDLIVLSGDLGAGKTRLAQGLGAGLGVEDHLTSPTFILANRYEVRSEPSLGYLHHLDVYRLASAQQAYDLDLPELRSSGVVIIEWGENILAAIGAEYLLIEIEHLDSAEDMFAIEQGQRNLNIKTAGVDWADKLESLKSEIVALLGDRISDVGIDG